MSGGFLWSVHPWWQVCLVLGAVVLIGAIWWLAMLDD